MLLEVILLVICVENACDGANILAIIPTPSFSHQVAFRELWKELSLRGHNVTLATTDPINDPSLKNLTEIDMSNSYEVWSQKCNVSQEAQDGLGVWNTYEFFIKTLAEVAEDQMEKTDFQKLVKGRNTMKFDVVMVELFYPHLFIFGKIYNCPTIAMGTIGSSMIMYNSLGNYAHPMLNTDINCPFVGELSFKERLISIIFNINVWYIEHYILIPRTKQIIEKCIGNETSLRMTDLLSAADLMLINENPLFKGNRALGPNTIYVGGGSHLKPLKPLPQVFKKFYRC